MYGVLYEVEVLTCMGFSSRSAHMYGVLYEVEVLTCMGFSMK